MSLEDVPSYLAGITGINETTAQLILSVFMICLFLFPYLILAHKNINAYVSIILVFIGLSISLGFGWAPFWLMVMVIVLGAISVALLGAKVTTGNGG